MSISENSFRTNARKELALFLVLLLFGLVLLPLAIFVVGGIVFGDYGPAGFSGFYNTLIGKIRGGDWVAWFLVLSPYFAWQSVRLTATAWRRLRQPDAPATRRRRRSA